jgi:ribosome biogenesis GTPase
VSETTSSTADEFPELLGRYGWTPERARWWASNVAGFDPGTDPRPGRVSRVDRGECDVITASGPQRVVSDSQRAQGDVAPATGDWVAVINDPELGPFVGAVLPRTTAITRRDPGPVVVEQVLVANVDVVAVVHALDQSFSAARLERFLVLAHDSGAEPLVVLTKADLVDAVSAAETARELTDATVVVTAAPTGEGVDDVRGFVAGRTVVFMGLSGSGKSTLTNALMGDEVQVTADVRDGDARGRHTTTSRELFLLPGGGVLIDTPGVRAIGVWDAWPAVHRVYADVSAYASQCRFNDCTHGQEPGCAVTAAVAAGTLDAARVARYRQLMIELTELDDQIDESARRQKRGRPPSGRRRGRSG